VCVCMCVCVRERETERERARERENERERERERKREGERVVENELVVRRKGRFGCAAKRVVQLRVRYAWPKGCFVIHP